MSITTQEIIDLAHAKQDGKRITYTRIDGSEGESIDMPEHTCFNFQKYKYRIDPGFRTIYVAHNEYDIAHLLSEDEISTPGVQAVKYVQVAAVLLAFESFEAISTTTSLEFAHEESRFIMNKIKGIL